MNNQIWAVCGRMLYRIGGIVALPIFLHGTRRTRVAILNETSTEILLSVTWIGNQEWSLIGGGIHRNEDVLQAAVREVNEETGLELTTDQLTYIGERENKTYMATYNTYIYITHVKKFKPKKPPIELLDIAWFPLDSLPPKSSHESLEAVKKYLASKPS